MQFVFVSYEDAADMDDYLFIHPTTDGSTNLSSKEIPWTSTLAQHYKHRVRPLLKLQK